MSIRSLRKALLTICVCGLTGLTVHAQQRTFTVDAARSEVHFMLASTLHTVHGTFLVQTGEVSFNSTTGAAGGSIVVDAISGASGNGGRDKRMHKEELKSESFRTITFAPAKFTGKFNSSGDSALTVHGSFTLLGKAHEIDVPMQVQVSGGEIHAMGAFAVPYVEWGLKDPSSFVLKVNKEVQIELLLVGALQ